MRVRLAAKARDWQRNATEQERRAPSANRRLSAAVCWQTGRQRRRCWCQRRRRGRWWQAVRVRLAAKARDWQRNATEQERRAPSANRRLSAAVCWQTGRQRRRCWCERRRRGRRWRQAVRVRIAAKARGWQRNATEQERRAPSANRRLSAAVCWQTGRQRRRCWCQRRRRVRRWRQAVRVRLAAKARGWQRNATEQERRAPSANRRLSAAVCWQTGRQRRCGWCHRRWRG